MIDLSLTAALSWVDNSHDLVQQTGLAGIGDGGNKRRRKQGLGLRVAILPALQKAEAEARVRGLCP